VKALVDGGFLGKDISADVNAELTVSAKPFKVSASRKFFALSLLLMDALFTRFQRNTFSQLSSISDAMNYLQWNMGTKKFTEFLVSAEKHRKEAAYKSSAGASPSLEDWALHRIPRPKEYHQPRISAAIHALQQQLSTHICFERQPDQALTLRSRDSRRKVKP
jgi:hypothetical protein